MDPHLKGGKTGFYAALDAAVTSISADLSKERIAAQPGTGGGSSLWWLILPIGGAGALVFLIVGTARRKAEPDVGLKSYERKSYTSSPYSGALAGAMIGGGVGAGVVAASLASAHRETPRPKKKEEARRSSSSSDSGSSYGSSSSSWSDSSSSGSSSSFSGGGGDFGGGGASGGD